MEHFAGMLPPRPLPRRARLFQPVEPMPLLRPYRKNYIPFRTTTYSTVPVHNRLRLQYRLDKGSRQVDYLQIAREQWSRHVNKVGLLRLFQMPGPVEEELLEDGDVQ
uniref:Uncharacterized protein n=1 Tax=Cacopsylla melanoneura TaxID=428564 RepID=A0A8D9ABD7_9HEMI